MSKIYLKIKIKSLAAEARIIRHQERIWRERGRPFRREHAKRTDVLMATGNWPIEQIPEKITALLGANSIFWGLRSHRTADVRSESRAALLAYGFLRGRRYAQMEAKCYDPPNWSRIGDIVKKFGALDPARNRNIADTIREWAEAGPD